MSQADQNQEQSMEEILQSIKRIIADESDDDDDSKAEMDNSTQVNDVLELTELAEEPLELDEIVSDEAMGSAARMDPVPVFEPVPLPQATAPRGDINPEPQALLSEAAAMASANALSSLFAETDKPQAPVSAVALPPFRSGATIEDLVSEALRPMLQEWLNAHLPALVERVVEREVRRISPK